jgi:two-component system, OmpR family, response regulator
MVEVGTNAPEPDGPGAHVSLELTPEYLGGLVHELRNPLSPIRTSAELLRSLCNDPRQLQAIELISRQVMTLAHMLDDLVEAARRQRGLLLPTHGDVDVAESEPHAPGAARSLRIVIIDDHAASVHGWVESMVRAGHSVLTAPTGELGVALAAQFEPDAVIVDIGLPGIDGFDVGRALRARPRMSDVLMIAVSGYSLKQFRDLDAYTVFRHYLLKPVSPAALLYIIEQSIDHARYAR